MSLVFNFFENIEEVAFQFIDNSIETLEGLYQSIIDLLYWIPNEPIFLFYLSTIVAALITISTVRWIWSG